MDFAGSVMIVVAESAEEAKNMLKDDIYVKAGVWDFEKVRIALAVFIEAIETDTANQPDPNLPHESRVQIRLVSRKTEALYR